MSNKRCVEVKNPYLQPGWGCCGCSTYNGEQRLMCKACGHDRCDREAADTLVMRALLETPRGRTVH